MNPPIFAIYLYWHYGAGLKGLFRIWKNFLLFSFHFFSLLPLLQTLFSPWHRLTSSYGRGFDPMVWTRAFIENMISRILGAIVRSAVISMGILAELFIFIAGALLVLLWLILPLAAPLLFISALALIIPS